MVQVESGLFRLDSNEVTNGVDQEISGLPSGAFSWYKTNLRSSS